MDNYNKESTAQTSETINGKYDFLDGVDFRFGKLKKSLDKSLEYGCKKTFNQNDDSLFLLNELKKQNDFKINSNWKGKISRFRFDSFAVFLKKYHRIEGAKKENFWYIEIHSKDYIDCIICQKEKFDEYLNQLDYDKKIIKEQIEAGKRIIAPEREEENFTRDWRSLAFSDFINPIYPKDVIAIFNTNSLAIFSILGYSVMSLVLKNIDTSENKLLIPNIVYSEQTKEFLLKAIQSCCTEVPGSNSFGIMYTKLNKDYCPEKTDFDYKPIVIFYDKSDDSLLKNKLEKYYLYLSTNRNANFPYNGIPFIFSQEAISDHFLTINFTEGDLSEAERIYQALQRLYHNLFAVENNKRALYRTIQKNYMSEKENLIDALCQLPIRKCFTQEENTILSLFALLNLLIEPSLDDSEAFKQYKEVFINLYIIPLIRKHNYTYNMFCNNAERGSQANVDKFSIILNELNTMLSNNKILFIENKKAFKETSPNYDTLCALIEIKETTVLILGNKFCEELILACGLKKYSVKDLKKDAQKYGYSDCNSGELTKKISFDNIQKEFLALKIQNNKIFNTEKSS